MFPFETKILMVVTYFWTTFVHQFTIKKTAAKNKNRPIRAFFNKIKPKILNEFIPTRASSLYNLKGRGKSLQ